MHSTYEQGLTGTRYPTRPDNFWQYPIRTRFFFRIIGYFGYRVFHLFCPDKPVTLQDIHVGQYCFLPTQHSSSLDLSSVNTAKHSIHEVIQPICENSQIQNSADHLTLRTILRTLFLLFKKYALKSLIYAFFLRFVVIEIYTHFAIVCGG